MSNNKVMDTIKSEKKERVRPDYSRLGVPEDSESTVILTGYTPEEILDKVHCFPESRFRISKNHVVPVLFRYNWVLKGFAFRAEQSQTIVRKITCHFCDEPSEGEMEVSGEIEPVCEDCFQGFTGHTFKDIDKMTLCKDCGGLPTTGPRWDPLVAWCDCTSSLEDTGGEWKEFIKNHSPILESGQSIKQEALEYKCKECDTPLAEQNKGYGHMCHECWMNSSEVRYDNICIEEDEGGPIND